MSKRKSALNPTLSVPPLLTLPLETLDETIALIQSPSDLLSLALASKACSQIVIPRHSQYRIIRLRGRAPEVWAHLANRADLAVNIHTVIIAEEDNYSLPDKIPTTLLDLERALSRGEERDDNADKSTRGVDIDNEEVRVRNMCDALRQMRWLEDFEWTWAHPNRNPTRSPMHEDMIMWELSCKRTLKTLSLIGRFGEHTRGGEFDLDSSAYPLWNIRNLNSLTLLGQALFAPRNVMNLRTMLQRSLTITTLDIPSESPLLQTIYLPSLLSCRLSLQSGGTSLIDLSCMQFISRHAKIRDLWWFPARPVNLSCLELPPSLRRLGSWPGVIMASLRGVWGARGEQGRKEIRGELAQMYAALNVEGEDEEEATLTSNHALTPTTPTFPPSIYSSDAPSIVPQSPEHLTRTSSLVSIDGLAVSTLSLQALVGIDGSGIKQLRVSTFDDLSSLKALGDIFTGLTWLGVRESRLRSLDQWLDALSAFKSLETLRDIAIWSAVCPDHPIGFYTFSPNPQLAKSIPSIPPSAPIFSPSRGPFPKRRNFTTLEELKADGETMEKIAYLVRRIAERCLRLKEMDFWSICARVEGYRKVKILRDETQEVDMDSDLGVGGTKWTIEDPPVRRWPDVMSRSFA